MATRKTALELVRTGATWRDVLVEVVEDISSGWESSEGERAATYEEIHGYMTRYEGPLGRWAVGAVFESLGLELDTSEGITEGAITSAINAGPLAGTGIELTSIFDRSAVLRDLVRFGVRRAAESLGVEADSVEGLRGAVRASLVGEIRGQIQDQAGDLVEGAPDSELIARVVAAGPVEVGWNEPRDFSSEGERNRARQARYRSLHTKHWELRK